MKKKKEKKVTIYETKWKGPLRGGIGNDPAPPRREKRVSNND